jgi:peptide deformylase
MDLASGCGLASTQVFGDLRLFVARLSDESGVPYVEAFFNPIIIWSSEEIVGAWEGCLSYPNLMAFVYRHASIGVEYLDSSAVRKSVTFCENNARIVQHEMDHLEGITTMQKVAFQYRHLSTTCQQ